MRLRKQRITPSLQQPTPITDHALSLPEILHCIFHYLTQSELKCITSLVSRSWQQSSYALIQRAVTWVDYEYVVHREIPAYVIMALKANLHRLVYRGPSYREVHQYREEELKGSSTFTASTASTTSIGLDRFAQEAKETNWTSAVQELRVYSDYVEVRLLALLSVCRHITSLTMEMNYHSEIDLTVLMTECSRLTFLSVTGVNNPPSNPTDRGYYALSVKPELITVAYPLQYLILERIRLEQESLLGLVRHLPFLLHFNTVDLGKGPVMKCRQILDTLFLHCPKLKGFAFSQRAGEHLGGHELKLALDHYSTSLTDLGLCNMAIWRATLRSVSQHARNLTTLTIHHSPNTGAVPFEYVHSYLCSAPNLLHFYGLSTKMDVACFIQPEEPGAWACRRLKTLHMGISNLHCQTFKSSTLIYHYLVKICPEIQNLSLRPSYAWGCMPIGLRILTKLKDLKELTFHVDSWRMYGHVYLDWMDDKSSLSVWENPGKLVQPVLDALSISERSKRQKRLWLLGYREESEDMVHSGESGHDGDRGDTKTKVSSSFKGTKGKSAQKNQTHWTQLKILTIHCRQKQVPYFQHIESTFRQQRPDIMVKINPSYPPLRICRIF
ncbi:hypothetical protein BGZ81_005084 [Podila clonocystis]|nr:hypothetical protein BGZ81_005084 [Podila clonocystis]